ncbi:branched-chain amino acid ABC transporter [Saccharopolyspora aridisoli]|uniref:Branched-chain amino acid ABC transporter n=1 Tax=Saccharopolyspora aridisoli TaxID=2530385 RepID=A0A4V2Y7F7_9PSEU|nr:AzlD domain-containing protein [Saccharopolyspora aridisoli]TDC91845.1 branched-chain amino acid ABC transporter [Saccharopolyspora aridisoli]
MPDPMHIAGAVAVSVAVTWALRALPFAALAPLRSSATVHYLGARMPVGVMVILAVYTLHDTQATAHAPTALSLVATIGLHLWKRDPVLSILGGTTVHVLLTSVVFAQSW